MEIIIIGGGLAGLVSGILLKRAGHPTTLFEEKEYPFNRVCGEYISNEVIPFLEKENLFPHELKPADLSRFRLSSTSGKLLEMPLDLGGFGVSRLRFDHWLSEIAKHEGVEIIHERVTESEFRDGNFIIETKNQGKFTSEILIGAFGKRSWMDRSLIRPFLEKRSPYIGVKYHIRTDEVADDVIELHNFDGGYCGVSRVEDGQFNLCYLSHRRNLKQHAQVHRMEREILFKNPHLKRIFTHSEFFHKTPLVINEITFEPKEAVYNHILMTGDAAGMITPLCGNGMAMAIHSAKILSELIINHCNDSFDRKKLEKEYAAKWNKLFSTRLWAGRNIQNLFGNTNASGLAVGLGQILPPFSRFLMRQTHGQPFS